MHHPLSIPTSLAVLLTFASLPYSSRKFLHWLRLLAPHPQHFLWSYFEMPRAATHFLFHDQSWSLLYELYSVLPLSRYSCNLLTSPHLAEPNLSSEWVGLDMAHENSKSDITTSRCSDCTDFRGFFLSFQSIQSISSVKWCLAAATSRQVPCSSGASSSR